MISVLIFGFQHPDNRETGYSNVLQQRVHFVSCRQAARFHNCTTVQLYNRQAARFYATDRAAWERVAAQWGPASNLFLAAHTSKSHRITPGNHSQLLLESTQNYTSKSLAITSGNHSQLHLEITQNHTWKSFKSTSENYFRITLVYYSESHLDTGHYFELQPDITHNLMSLERLEKGGISGVFQKDIEIWRDANANSPWTTLR